METSVLEPQKLSDQATHLCWETGRLKYKLQPRQRIAYDKIKECPPEKIFCVVCSRGYGKTFIGCDIVLETARKNKDVNILIISSTLKKLRMIVKPAFDTLLMDCPAEFKPKYNSQDSYYEFPNGVRVHLLAAEKRHIEDARGIHKVVLVLIDEAAFFGHEEASYPLNHVIENILNPMFLRTQSKARIIMMSTPPEVPNHPFDAYCDEAELNGCFVKFTIYESDIAPERIEEQRIRCKDPIAWRREYLCERVVDQNRVIIPEWKGDYVQEVTRDDKFRFWDKYFSVDTGSVDKTVGLLAYYDFLAASLVVEDEIIYEGRSWTTDDLAKDIREKELTQWGKDAKVYRRVGDSDNQILLADLTLLHSLPIRATTKDSLQAMVNLVRMWAAAGRIKVHPRCKLLIQTLKAGIWNKTKDEFARSPILGHMDALAALVYMVRNVDIAHNPIPPNYGYDAANQYWNPEHLKSPAAKTMERALVNGNPFLKKRDETW